MFIRVVVGQGMSLAGRDDAVAFAEPSDGEGDGDTYFCPNLACRAGTLEFSVSQSPGHQGGGSSVYWGC